MHRLLFISTLSVFLSSSPSLVWANCTLPGLELCDCSIAKTVICSGVGLNHLPDVPDDTQHITIKECNIGIIAAMPSYRNALVLSLRNNGIHTIQDDTFALLSKLHKLELNANQLQRIRGDMFAGLHNLTQLSLAGNKIHALDNGSFPVGHLHRLKILNLNQNELSTISPGAFHNLTTVVDLDLSMNSLTQVPAKALTRLTSLRRLQLEKNKIKGFGSGSFKELPNLESLDISGNHVGDIDIKTFEGLSKLNALFMNNCSIISIASDSFLGFQKVIQKIGLQFNKLQHLPETLLLWDKLKELELRGNQWTCDCDLDWMASYEAFKYLNLTCTKPDNLKGKIITSLKKEQFSCAGATADRGGTNTAAVVFSVLIPIIIVGAIIAIAAYFLIKRHQQRNQRKSVRYSAVYKDTVEASRNRNQANKPPRPERPPRPTSEL